MKIHNRLIALSAAALIALGAGPTDASAQDAAVHGGWVIADWAWGDGGDGPVPQRGIFVFTETGHYSMLFVIGDQRAPLDGDSTDADRVAAWGPLVANSGRYTASGGTISYEAFVAKDPAYMAGFAPTGGDGNEQTIEYEVSDGALMVTFGPGGPMGGATATLRRPGGGD